MKVPHSISDVSASWLSGVLKKPIDDIDIQPVGDGYMSDVFRIRLRSSSPGPGSLILKLSASSHSMRRLAERFNSYTKESNFYAELTSDLGIRVPHCYYNETDEEGFFALCLEDLDGLAEIDRGIDIESGADLAQTLLAMETIARLHAHFWQHEPAGTPTFATGFNAAAQDLKSARLPNDPGSSRASTLTETYVENAIDYLSHFESQKHVLSHMDFRLDNLKFTNTELILFDWGEYSLAPPGFDVAYFLVTSVTGENRQRWEQQALEQYLDTLKVCGIEDYSQSKLLTSYQLCLLPAIYMPILMMNTGDIPQSRTLFDRIELAIDDHFDAISRQLSVPL